MPDPAGGAGLQHHHQHRRLDRKLGAITAGRAETWRRDYEARIAVHREAVRAKTGHLGWSFIIHRTDRPATELLLALHLRLGAPPAGAALSARAAPQHTPVLR